MNAADMLSQYKNASLEFGAGNKSEDSPDEGTQKLANELDDFVTKGEKGSQNSKRDLGALSDDDIADLQLQTARKLREVSYFLDSSLKSSRNLSTCSWSKMVMPTMMRVLSLLNKMLLCVTLWVSRRRKGRHCRPELRRPPPGSPPFSTLSHLSRLALIFKLVLCCYALHTVLSLCLTPTSFSSYPTQTAPSPKQGIVKLGSGTKLDPCLAGLVKFT